VTATGEEQRIREQGNAISRVELPEARLAAVPNFSNAIAGQAPGVQVLQSGGTTGTGSRVRIRGANSLSLSNEPLIIIDGVRVNSSAESSSIGTGGQAPSRLNDINPEDIESIEILKGPAASGLYGTQAANGVIQITTKRGAAGAPRWTAWLEAGTIVEHNAYPANYGGWYTTEDGEVDFGCDLMSVAGGFCVQDSLAAFNPLEVNSPFRDGSRGQYGLSVSGGTERLTYYVSGELENEAGIYRTNSLDRLNLRGNFRLGLSESFTATVTTGFLSSDQKLPQNDNNFLGYISNGIAGTALPDGGLDEDGYDPVGPRTIDQIDWRQESRRFLSSVNGDWRPLSWLRVTGTAGLDLLNRYDNETLPVGAVLLDADTEAGERTSNRLQFSTWTTNVSGIADYPITESLRGTTTLGFQYQRELSEGTFAFGAGLAAGTGNLGGATERFEVDESYADNRLAGGILTQQLAWQDRLFLTLGVRGDDNSAFGENFGTIYYPSAQLSWVVSEEPYFPQPAWLSTVRLRGAFGQSGLRPGNRDAVTFFSPVPVRVAGSEEPGITFGGVGDPDLEPERTTEFEVGFDVGALDDRVRIDAGYYNKVSKDALVSTRTAPSAGVAGTIFRNLGSIRNTGVEVQLGLRPIQRENLEWNVTINHSENRNEVEDLGENPAIIFGLGGASQRHEEGFPAGAYFGEVIESYADNDGDGIVDEINYGDERYLGPSQPRRMTTFQTDVTLFGSLRLAGLVDYRGGYKQYNATEDFRCAIFTCRGLNDPDASLEEQANAMAAADGVYSGFIEDADFVKLREVSLTYTVPERFASRLNASGLSITLAGQNLGLWTDYTGLDPEINFAGQDNYSQGDFLSQPQVRRFTARVNVNF
jgi:TonB-linked SusC/RagA family outer membrane protein